MQFSKSVGIGVSFFLLVNVCCAVYSEESAGNNDKSVMIYHVSPDTDYAYSRPKTFSFLTNSPKDLVTFCKDTFQKKNILSISMILGATGILLVYDQKLVDAAHKFGQRNNISGADRMVTAARAFGHPIVRLPADFGSALYFLGDGWTHTAITATFFTYGMITSDNRALTTSSELAEGLITTAFTTQFLKHITGRQDPSTATMDGGKWTFFPNQATYLKHVPFFDAFPTGHLATAMMVVTIIADNYPEHTYIRPLGYSLMTLLGFQMLNNGVHWASDYPVGIAIGYMLAKVSLANGNRTVISKNASTAKPQSWTDSLMITPILSGDCAGAALSYRI